MIFLVLYIFLGFVFSQTVFESTLAVYISFVALFIFFSAYLLQNIGGRKDFATLIWMPYLFYTIGGYLLQSNFQQLSYWAVCLSLIVVAAPVNIIKSVPYRLIYGIGVFAMFGIAIQLVFPGFYNSFISPLFKADLNSSWVESNYGFAGFSYQLDQTGMQILYAEGVMIFLYILLKQKFKSNGFKYLMIVLSVICVFMTGKRMLALISVVAPILTFLFSQKSGAKRLWIIIAVSVFSIVGYSYLEGNAEKYSESIVIGRFARSITKSEAGEDITSNRSILTLEALSYFSESPISGIGVGEFPKRSSMKTDTHNTYLQVLCEQGIIGIVFFIIPLLYCIIKTIKTTRIIPESPCKKLLRFSLYIQLTYILYSYSGNTNINLTGFVMYFIAIAILVNCGNNIKFGCYDC